MNAATRTELLSAHLDGRLAGEDAQRVEHLLATDADARSEYEGLRSTIGRLRHLERLAPPASLDLAVARRIALEGEHRSLLDRVEDRLWRVQGQSTTLVLFAVVLALAIILLLFSLALDRSRESLLPATFESEGVVATPDERLPKARSVIAAGRIFERESAESDDHPWIESGLDPAAPYRVVGRQSPEGRALLAAHPELETLDSLGDTRLRLEGEVVELRDLERSVLEQTPATPKTKHTPTRDP